MMFYLFTVFDIMKMRLQFIDNNPLEDAVVTIDNDPPFSTPVQSTRRDSPPTVGPYWGANSYQTEVSTEDNDSIDKEFIFYGSDI